MLGGVATVRHLERVLRRRTNVEITLVSRENFFACSRRSCSRQAPAGWSCDTARSRSAPQLQRARFIEATVQSVEVERQLVRAVAPEGGAYDLPYDHLVVVLSASTNDRLIPG